MVKTHLVANGRGIVTQWYQSASADAGAHGKYLSELMHSPGGPDAGSPTRWQVIASARKRPLNRFLTYCALNNAGQRFDGACAVHIYP